MHHTLEYDLKIDSSQGNAIIYEQKKKASVMFMYLYAVYASVLNEPYFLTTKLNVRNVHDKSVFRTDGYVT